MRLSPLGRATVLWTSVALAALPGGAESPGRPEVAALATEGPALELILSDPEWIGNPPERPYWSDDGRWVYYWQEKQGADYEELLRVPASGGEPQVVAPAERGAADVPDGHLSRDRRSKTYAHAGDVFVKDLASGEIRQLTRTADRESDPRFLVGDRRIAFHRGDTVYVRDLDSGLEYQPAELRLEDDPADKKKDPGYLARQQTRLFDVVRERQQEQEDERERNRAEQAADPSRPPLPWYLGDKLELRRRSLSPSGDWMLLVTAPKKRDDGQRDQMPSWVTDSGYVETREVRPKVGTGDGTGDKLVVLDLVAHTRHDVDLSVLPGITDDPLAELRRAAEERRAAERSAKGEKGGGDEDVDRDRQKGEAGGETRPGETRPGAARTVRFEAAEAWSFDGEHVAVQARSYDNKDRWIAVLRRGRPELVTLHRLTHEAWINWHFNDYGWLPDGRTLYYLSEESGTSQLYVRSVDSGEARRLSTGRGVVSDPQPSADGRYLYFTANPEQPGLYEAFRVEVTSGEIEQLSRLGGRNHTLLSPDGQQLLITHSTTTHPPELYAQAAAPGATARRLTETVSEAFLELPWVAPEVVAVPSSHHDRPIYSRFYAPAEPAGAARPDAARPAVVFIHGAGYLQNAHQGWSSYFREFMFHTFLVHHGYLVLDMDYRGSAGYGAAWRTAIYRQMGTPELEDLEDGVEWLVEHGADRGRIGVYGGSYGGFLTLMALFKKPDLFACGAALRPVTDWAHYNHGYTSNILNTPDVDPEAYEKSSPIEFADGLRKPLLICAPMLDDNVFFQDTVRLSQRLIELGKEDWQVALFPVEPHGFRRPSSWLDEYRRIFELFETHLQR